MTDRFPLIIDTSGSENKIKELPQGDNLNLQGNNIVNAQTVTVDSLETGILTVNGSSLKSIAFTGDYDDLLNTPTLFDKDYNSLDNLPFIPSSLQDLNNVDFDQPSDRQTLVWSQSQMRFVFEDKVTEIDIANYKLQDLGDVSFSSPVTNKFIKFYSGGWRESFVDYTEIINKPTNVSDFVNDAEYITKTEFKTIVAESADFQEFKSKINFDL